MGMKLEIDGAVVETRRQGSLLELMLEAGAFVDAPCGGKGRCGKCRVAASGELSPPTEAERRLLSPAELADGIRLACEAKPLGDVQVRTLSRTDIGVEVSGSAAEYPVDAPWSEGRDVGMAVDIGTTTVVAYFHSLADGRLLYTASGINGQRAYGADVISRIAACMDDPNALAAQQRVIVAQLNGYLGDFERATGVGRARIGRAVIVGNTTMQHLLCGLDPAGIAVAPFVPKSLFGIPQPARELDLAFDGEVYHGPGISAYVGADITAGLLASGAAECDAPALLIDVGTNGEMALADKHRLVCCSTAAGPAFEGAHIRYGVGGVAGAISQVNCTPDGFSIATIGDQPPIGICGSGIIDAVAAVLEAGAIDETGRILDEDEIEGFAAGLLSEDGDEILLDSASGITLTQEDVRVVQLAKAAIAAGIDTLLHSQGLTLGQIGKLYIAGGFGAHINKVSACAIGLLPIELIDRMEFIGNAAGMGARRALLTADGCDRLRALAARAEYIELSGDKFFEERYVEQMLFPEQ
ncbi:ASKHA domain-containing protein [Ligaoa zhengdingensis]|uniref:ASKHA domain-containing protein n=1 Tax=Ligaoa zhengdingensis TaxID=2763658 RepID=UPI0031BA6FEF